MHYMLYVAFSIGANNVANAAGPVATMTMNELNIIPAEKNFVLIMILSTLIVAPSFGIRDAKLGFKNVFRKTEVNNFFAMWIIAPATAFLLAIFLIFSVDKFNYLSHHSISLQTAHINISIEQSQDSC